MSAKLRPTPTPQGSNMAQHVMLRWLAARNGRRGPITSEQLERVTRAKNVLLHEHGLVLAGMEPEAAYRHFREMFTPAADAAVGDRPPPMPAGVE